MKTRILALAALVALGSTQVWAQTNNISSVGITTGVVTVTARIGPNSQPAGPPNNSSLLVGNNLAGLAYAAGNIPGAADTSISFFTLTGATLPGGAGNPLDAFMSYGTLIGPPAATLNYPDVAPLLTADSYLGLTFAATDLYPGGPAPLTANGFYMIHRNLTNGTDYLAGIVPATGGGSAVLNIKPMAWTGGVAATGASVVAGTNHYFALAFAVPTPAGPYFANNFYYLRTDASNHTQFGYVIPALTSGFLDTLDLNTATGGFGATGYTTLAFSATAIGGYAVNQFYYLRLDAATGYTVLGRLDTNPANRTLSDIANLGGVYSGLTFAAEATGTGAGWGTNQLYATGTRALTAQSVSFAAIADRTFVGDVPFVVTPSASSGLDLVVTVVSGPATVVTTGPALARVHTVTTTGPGVVKLRATQSGPGFDTNYLEQSFNVLGLPAMTSATTASATAGTPFTFSLTATGNPILSFAATGLPANGLTINTTTGVISGTPLAAGTINVTGITATNATGTSTPGTALTITVAAAVPAPVVNSTLTASGTVGVAFSYSITGTNTPTGYAATGLPAGLAVNTTTGAITGTPT
ncbi:MAG: putative Ig domain-containing protein, partial [Lacunisphaera sp.]|nr:putative Ig domain-containing protein [Lacunisphaera sp.]